MNRPRLPQFLKPCLMALALQAGMFSLPSHALEPVASTSKWTGTYQDEAGNLLVILAQDRKMEAISHYRGASFSGFIYRLACTEDGAGLNFATCMGDGLDFGQPSKPKRGTYRSKLRRNSDGTLNEQWEIKWDTGTQQGDGKYKKVHSIIPEHE